MFFEIDPKRRGRCQLIALLATSALLAGCGPASDANAAQRNGSTASAQAALPIEQGIYGDTERGGCSLARNAFFYDGTHYGYVSPAEPGWNDLAYFEANLIVRTGPAAQGSDFYDHYRGYTLVWHTDNLDAEEDILGVKSDGNGRITTLAVSYGSRGEVFSGETYQKCTFSDLSPQMQATIRAERPQLAGAVAPASSAPARTAQTGSLKFPPVPQGYYAVDATCANAASAQAASDGPASLAVFDETALSWFDGGPEIAGFEALGDNRFRVRARSYGNGDDDSGESADFVIRVTGASSFVTEPGSLLFEEQQTFTHCPTGNVPQAVRDWFEY